MHSLSRSCRFAILIAGFGLMSDLRADDGLSLAPHYASMQATAPSGGGGSDEHLAKQLSNPVANLISVPFQFNWDTGIGPKEADRYLLNIQPVIPITLNEQYNLIVRTIVPVIYQDSPATGISSEFGLGDTVQSFFLSPKDPVGGWIVGAGPVFLWPTGTDPLLGSEKWGAGPTIVGLRQDGPWTYGLLANHIWSYAGDGDRADVNATFLQPFINYTTPDAWSFVLNTETTYDWTAEEWTIPINAQILKLLRFGKQPVQIGGGIRYYADSPPGGPEWGFRIQVTFLFPK